MRPKIITIRTALTTTRNLKVSYDSHECDSLEDFLQNQYQGINYLDKNLRGELLDLLVEAESDPKLRDETFSAIEKALEKAEAGHAPATAIGVGGPWGTPYPNPKK